MKDSIADAVRDADAVLTTLPAGTDVDDVMTCADGVFASIHSGTLVVDCSAIGIDYARKLHSAAEKVGATFVEAPVSGGTEGAIAGTLTFMTGGTEKGCAEIEAACQLTDQGVNDLRRALGPILQANEPPEERTTIMRIGILGVGHIGKTLAQRLAQAGHSVKVANSRGPETIAQDVLAFGAQAVTPEEALADVDVVILSIPLNRIPDIAPLIARNPEETVVIDTSNYYPLRDDKIEAIEAGQVESLWVVEQLGRPIAKAWNAIGSGSLAHKATPAGTAGRIAIPVAADRAKDREVALALVNDSGFDGFDAGSLADSWHQQPGAPAYCTDLTREEMGPALTAAEKARLPKRRDLSVAVIHERLGDGTTNPDADWGVRLVRAIYM